MSKIHRYYNILLMKDGFILFTSACDIKLPIIATLNSSLDPHPVRVRFMTA